MSLRASAGADDRLDLQEWCVLNTLIVRLDKNFGRRGRTMTQHYSLKRLGKECATLLAVVARIGHEDLATEQAAYNAGVGHLEPAVLGPYQRQTLSHLGPALETLSQVSPKLKKQLVSACGHVIVYDHEVTTTEAEAFRAIADLLGCPAPPLLPGQRLV